MRILLIEEEQMLREHLGQRLQAEGYSVDASGDGKEGLYLASEYPVDLAVMTCLPGLPGLEIIRTLRTEGRDLPILILTARGKWEEKVTGLEAGADDYLVKPRDSAPSKKALRPSSSHPGCGLPQTRTLPPHVFPDRI